MGRRVGNEQGPQQMPWAMCVDTTRLLVESGRLSRWQQFCLVSTTALEVQNQDDVAEEHEDREDNH